jgi:hypothetical protein
MQRKVIYTIVGVRPEVLASRHSSSRQSTYLPTYPVTWG